MGDDCLKFIAVGTGPAERRIAVRARAGGSLVGRAGLALCGFKSDMNRHQGAGSRISWAQAHGRALVRFDYSGHGESGGEFEQGTIGRWLEESVAVFRACCRGPQLVVGSSMGGWLALLLVRALGRAEAAATVAGLVLIAPGGRLHRWRADGAAQFLPARSSCQIEESGSWQRPSSYGDEPYPITRGLIEEARGHLLLGEMIETGCPVRILQGVADPDVPWQHAVELTSRLARDDVVLTLVKDGDHRLSRPEDIERLLAVVAEF